MVRAFMISSAESLNDAALIKNRIETEARSKGVDINVVLWFDWFREFYNTNEYNWDIIENACKEFMVVISILRADDTVRARDGEYKVTRDNVLIETGAFINALGKENVFLLVDEDSAYKTPSDFLGINVSRFNYNYGAENKKVISNIIERCSRKEGIILQEIRDVIKGEQTPVNNYATNRDNIGGRLI